MENTNEPAKPQPEVSTPEVDSNGVKKSKLKWLRLVLGLVIAGIIYYLVFVIFTQGYRKGISEQAQTQISIQNENIPLPRGPGNADEVVEDKIVLPTTTTPDPSADWKTYENTKYGYTVKYPRSYYLTDWLYDERTKIKVNTGDFVHIDKTRRDDDYYLANAGGMQAYFRIMSVNTESNELKLTVDGLSVSNTKVDDQNAFIHTTTKPSDYDGSYYSEIRLNYGGKFYSISWVNEDLNGNHDKTIDQILSTFTFTK